MTILLVIALLLYLAGSLHATFLFAANAERSGRELIAYLLAGGAAHAAAIALDGWRLGFFPIVNVKEVSSLLAWALVVALIAVSVRWRLRALAVFLLPLIVFLTLAALLAPDTTAALSPQLHSAIAASPFTQIIFPLHVTLVIFAYAAFITTFACGVIYLVQERELKTKHFGAIFARLPALSTCDELGHRAAMIGFVLLTMGIVTGILWNSQRDGRYWHNDPKEVLALATWIVYLFLMHYRLTAGWRGRRAALISIAGFVVVLLTWLGARALGGYHVFS